MANGRSLILDRPRLMAIINATPDSFYAGSRTMTDTDRALDHARAAIAQGADMLDIGGESTRPGAARVPAAEQIARVVPVIERLRAEGAATPISVDTTLVEVARHALDAGADAVNDVSGATDSPDLLALCASRGAGVVLMHREAPPDRDRYSDEHPPDGFGRGSFDRVAGFLTEALKRTRAAGIDDDQVVLDPGLGFGKSVPQNLELIARTRELLAIGRPVLAAASRKSFVGRVSLDRDSQPEERLAGTLGVGVVQLALGLRLFRVHDVAAHREALAMAWAILADGGTGTGGLE